MRNASFVVAFACVFVMQISAADRFADRFVWIFGWNLQKDSDVEEILPVLETARKHRLNGAVLSAGLDSLCKQSPEYFRRLDIIKKCCEENGLELIPAVFSPGYGGGVLAHDPNLAEGFSVEGAPFLVTGSEARLATTNSVSTNGGFEEFTGKKIQGFDFHDQPGEISFVDMETRHGGKASIRLENFTANQHGHGRVMQSVTVKPRRCYRLTLWVRTEGLQPASAFRVLVRAGDCDIAPREFHVPTSTDWRKLTMVFNSLNYDKISIYAGVWGGKDGKVWLDDWSVEEAGPINVLHRPGTPVKVRSEDSSVTYVEGKDYSPLQDPSLHPWRDDVQDLPLKVLPGGRIRNGERLRVSWYHSMIINDSQVGICMAEPAVYEILAHEAKLLAEKLQPRSVFLNVDEIRMGGTCGACEGQNMAKLLGDCISKEASIIRKHNPSVEIYAWSDMLDPNHNAHGNYYLVNGDFSGSWTNVPRNLIMTVWSREPREASLRFFAEQGYRTLVACYYDADDLEDVKGWLKIAQQSRKLRGFMYTPWEKKYGLLPDFAELLRKPAAAQNTTGKAEIPGEAR